MINLTKRPKINLVKGQTINLTKDGTKEADKLTSVFFGASWGKIKGGWFSSEESVDLDASLICYDDKKNNTETIYYGHKRAKNGSINHSGDDLVGGKTDDADNETVSVNLDKIDSSVSYIVATLNSYSGQKFDKLPYIRARIYTGSIGNPDEILCAYNLDNSPEFKGKTSVILGYFYRKDGSWKFRADGTCGDATRITELESKAKQVL